MGCTESVLILSIINITPVHIALMKCVRMLKQVGAGLTGRVGWIIDTIEKQCLMQVNIFYESRNVRLAVSGKKN
jgi:hypothetical protein